MNNEEYLFIEDVAKMFRISPNTLRRRSWRQKMGLPSHKVGKRQTFNRTELEHWYKRLNG